MTYFLKFPSEDVAKEVMADYVTEDGWLTGGFQWALDVLGVIYKDEVALDGWHLNFTGPLEQPNDVYTPDGQVAPEVTPCPVGTLSLEAQLYLVEPKNPVRIFA